MEFVRVDSNNGSILSVQFSDMERILPAKDDIVVELIPATRFINFQVSSVWGVLFLPQCSSR